eukprot:comp23358_c1_seq1/m.38590 comp23358_c1_seq1/g.38590  ORF comp23358_c1_seq1/g.38590 comp23358_c1_seq1/m.38590 type:complete len:302 (+) comp23358_c1_seq1:590-1495(+)
MPVSSINWGRRNGIFSMPLLFCRYFLFWFQCLGTGTELRTALRWISSLGSCAVTSHISTRSGRGTSVLSSATLRRVSFFSCFFDGFSFSASSSFSSSSSLPPSIFFFSSTSFCFCRRTYATSASFRADLSRASSSSPRSSILNLSNTAANADSCGSSNWMSIFSGTYWISTSSGICSPSGRSLRVISWFFGCFLFFFLFFFLAFLLNPLTPFTGLSTSVEPSWFPFCFTAPSTAVSPSALILAVEPPTGKTQVSATAPTVQVSNTNERSTLPNLLVRGYKSVQKKNPDQEVLAHIRRCGNE